MKNPARKTWFAALGVFMLLLVALFAAACAGKQTYTMTFETNGGTQIAPITAEAGAQIDPPADPEKDGAVFGGWYLTSDFSGEAVEIPSVMPEENVTYYAKFDEIATAVLTLDAGLGTLDVTSYELEVGTDVFEFVSSLVPSAPEGLSFGGWFVGDSETMLAAGTQLPAAGLSLTARYTVSYTVEVYLQNAAGSEDYTLDADAGVAGGSGFVGATVDLISELSSIQGYTVNATRTQPLELTADAAQNVYRAYYDLRTYAVYYFDNAPAGSDVSGEMEDGTAYYGQEFVLPEPGFSVEGYRFAGWATSASGSVAYASGDEVTVRGITILYACWNRGLTDVNGGADVLYVLQEEPGVILLERAFMEPQRGEYDEDLRTFWFGDDFSDLTMPRGRVSADGATYAYYYEEYAAPTYAQFDWLNGEIVAGVTLKLDGMNGATYVNAAGDEISGTYTPSGSNYLFVSADEQTSFYFTLSVSEEGEELFLIRDAYANAYYFYSASEGTVGLPLIILDGYGNATYLASLTSMLSGTYVSQPNNIIELTFVTGTSEETLLVIRLASVSSSEQTYAVFTAADMARGDYTFRLDGTRAGTMDVVLDGFGSLTYVFDPDAEGEANVEGSAEYTYLVSYTHDGVAYGIFAFSLGSGESLSTYTVRFERETGNAVRIGNEGGYYSEYNATSGFTARLLLYGDGTATIYFSMQGGSYAALVEGTYALRAGETDIYTFTATSYAQNETQNYEELLSGAYGSFTFRLYQDNAIFVMSDGVEGLYSFTMGTGESAVEWLMDCNGFAYASVMQNGAPAGNVYYTVIDAYGEYSFIRFGVSTMFGTVYYYLRVIPGTAQEGVATPTDVFSGTYGVFADYGDRMPGYTETMTLYPDGHATLTIVTQDEAQTEVVIEGTYARDTQNDSLYVFTAQSVPGSAYEAYETFRFFPAVISQSYYYFCYYAEDEVATLTFRGQTLTLSGYGIATLGQSQYRYYFETQEDTTYLCIGGLTGGLVYRIEYDPATQQIVQEPGTEQGSYYSYLYDEENNRYVVGEYTLTLDGYGNATLSGLGESDTVEVLETGTYRMEGDVVAVTWTGGETFECIMTTATVNQSTVAIYVIGDASLEVTYTVNGSDVTIERDAFGRVTYIDGDVTSSAAFVQREVGVQNYLIVTVSGEEDEQTVYVYRMDGTSLTPTADSATGEYALLDSSRIYPSQSLVLDGFGSATLTQADGTQVTGTYAAAEDAGSEYTFTSENLNFTFMLTTVSSTSGTTYAAYVIYEEKWDALLSTQDWQIISVDGYGGATLIDFYGRAYAANYDVLGAAGNILHLYSSSLGNRYFRVNGTTFAEITEDYITEDGVLLAYQGGDSALSVPDGITAIAAYAFYGNSALTSVDLNGVRTVGDYAFYGCTALTSVQGDVVVTVGNYAFAACTRLESISLGAALTSVGNRAFAMCANAGSGIFTLELAGDSAPDMGEEVFYGCGAYAAFVAVKDTATAAAFRTAWEETYASYVGVMLSEEARAVAGVYYTDLDAASAGMLILGAQVILNGTPIGTYTVSGTTITVTPFDGSDPITGSFAEDEEEITIVSLTVNETAYTFYPAGTIRTFTSQDESGGTLAILLGYETTYGVYAGTLVEIHLGDTIWFELDGERYTVTLDMEAMTFAVTAESEADEA